MWFKALTGFCEESTEHVQKNLSLSGHVLKSLVNNKEYLCGFLEIPSLGELRNRIQLDGFPAGKLSVREVVADVQYLHLKESNRDALFQVASQFNLLEMISPHATPEHGVDIYEDDSTQGPACAVAAGAGTIYRNYFVTVNGQTGQSTANQIDCLADIGSALGNSGDRLWVMQNGYALASEKGLFEINNKLKQASESERDELRELLRIGIQWNTEVTISDSRQTVSQAYCSALPVAYSEHSPDLWAKFAQLILEATYEATICAGILNYQHRGNNTIYLTLVGGGAFGNKNEWILNALSRTFSQYRHVGLDVVIVSYGNSNHSVRRLIQYLSN